MKEVFRIWESDPMLIYRVVEDNNGTYHVECPVVGSDGKIEDWNPVRDRPEFADPTYDTLEEAKAFIIGMEYGIQGQDVKVEFKNGKLRKAYDEGLKFGLNLNSNHVVEKKTIRICNEEFQVLGSMQEIMAEVELGKCKDGLTSEELFGKAPFRDLDEVINTLTFLETKGQVKYNLHNQKWFFVGGDKR